MQEQQKKWNNMKSVFVVCSWIDEHFVPYANGMCTPYRARVFAQFGFMVSIGCNSERMNVVLFTPVFPAAIQWAKWILCATRSVHLCVICNRCNVVHSIPMVPQLPRFFVFIVVASFRHPSFGLSFLPFHNSHVGIALYRSIILLVCLLAYLYVWVCTYSYPWTQCETMPTVAKAQKPFTWNQQYNSMKISGSECQAHRTIRRQFGISKQASSKPLCFCSTAFNRMLFLTRGNFLLAANQTNATIQGVGSFTFICQSINLLYECYSII